MLLIRHTGIYVRDLEKMRDFYCRYFDMSIAAHEFEEGEYISTVLGVQGIKVELYKLIRKDGSMLELIKAVYPDSVETVSGTVLDLTTQGCHHMAFTVECLDDMYKRMLSENVMFISPPRVSSSSTAYVCFCQDPEGNYMELVQEL